ncbi:protein MpDOXC26 [Marchantia polymorpha subsp. ruderalis]|uniref:Fe2OG dioxygenase domain-containing protein n=2 Tax=Marchantia polymorpha TaxID=3197 RepID=A0AAF6B8P7_MARPO|nr:hypothetical protein MARPO_0011s0097 [Marchantia polymorpha]BBN08381.1 hypothetical protein Mp_4g11120 [Marchantia polymorpha subsp. ruderalis]|eukprot:PTQ46417.1 hypothetical protein MARPO_0011s0097 [Marchantia polymorpha]
MSKFRSVLFAVAKLEHFNNNSKMTISRASFSSIPIIDISPLIKMRSHPKHYDQDDMKEKKVVKEIDEACRKVGFFYVQGHGVPFEMIDLVRKLGHDFFNLSTEEKHTIKMTQASGWRGYQTLGENVTKGISDMHEAIDYFRDCDAEFPRLLHEDHPLSGRNLWPSSPAAFQPVYKQYLTIMQDLGRTILEAIGLALVGSRDAFEGTRAGNPFWLLRVIGYPPMEQKVTEVGCGEHTDYGLLTLVNQDDGIRALQVKNEDGDWIWADPIPGTFVVNIGDMLKVWSNGEYMPTVHRVLNDGSKYRVSVPYFYEPNFDAVVEPLDICKKRAEGISKYAPVVYGDHLTNKILNNFK